MFCAFMAYCVYFPLFPFFSYYYLLGYLIFPFLLSLACEMGMHAISYLVFDFHFFMPCLVPYNILGGVLLSRALYFFLF